MIIPGPHLPVILFTRCQRSPLVGHKHRSIRVNFTTLPVQVSASLEVTLTFRDADLVSSLHCITSFGGQHPAKARFAHIQADGIFQAFGQHTFYINLGGRLHGEEEKRQ